MQACFFGKRKVSVMERVISVIQVILPIFCCFFLGLRAREKAVFSSDDIQSFQRFVVKFCLPCLLFRSCLTAQIGVQSLSGLVLPVLLAAGAVWGFRVGRKWFPYHNIPFAFCCKETGMLGIPLFMILFGAEEAFRVGILDVTQAVVAFPVIAILSAAPGTAASPKAVLKEMLRSPLLLFSLLGLLLNLSGTWRWMQSAGVGGIVLDTFSYIAQPVSVIMLFCVGFNFSLEGDNRKEIFRILAAHTTIFIVLGGIFQAVLFLFPGVDALTRWAVLLYTFLPNSFLVPSLGRTKQDFTITSGASSVMTVICLAVFCVITVIVS